MSGLPIVSVWHSHGIYIHVFSTLASKMKLFQSCLCGRAGYINYSMGMARVELKSDVRKKMGYVSNEQFPQL